MFFYRRFADFFVCKCYFYFNNYRLGRFKLFLSMFTKQKSDTFYIQNIIINDKINGNHFTSLISRTTNKEKVEIVKSDLEKFNK